MPLGQIKLSPWYSKIKREGLWACLHFFILLYLWNSYFGAREAWWWAGHSPSGAPARADPETSIEDADATVACGALHRGTCPDPVALDAAGKELAVVPAGAPDARCGAAGR